MSPAVDSLDLLPREEALENFLSCCGSRRWAVQMVDARPFRDLAGLLSAADRIWEALPESAWLEAFAAHPRIGDRSASGEAATEQSSTRAARPEILTLLDAANREYQARFGHLFIVCASGKTADEMLALCRKRLHNDPKTELVIAAEEQRKITRLRLTKLAGNP